MKQVIILGLASILVWVGCGSDEPAKPDPASKPLPTGGDAMGDLAPGGMGADEAEAKPGGGLAEQTNNVGITKIGATNRIPVLAEMNGRFYEVYDIADKPYTGKVVVYHEDGNTPASEKVYSDGLLLRHTQWHDNSNKKMEAVRQASGEMKRAYFDEDGKPVKAPVKIVTAVGRGLEWFYGGGNPRIEMLYKGKSTDIIMKAFGEPDEINNDVWVYKGMKVKIVPGNKLMTTVRFVIQNQKVLDVSVEP